MSIRNSFVFASLLAFAQPQTGALTGRVVNSITRAPIARARVTLSLLAGSPSQPALETDTDASGTFEFSALAPGRYAVRADRPAFTVPPIGTNGLDPYDVIAAETITVRDNALAPQAVISGRVVDASGEPVPNANIELIRLGAPIVYSSNGSGRNTDERGVFRFSKLSAGTYNVAASGVAAMVGGSRLASAKTYYPSAVDRSQASNIRLGPGDERADIEIRLRQVPIVRASGTVSGLSGRAENVHIQLRPANQRLDHPSAREVYSTVVTPQQNGQFSVSGLRPGEYTLVSCLG